MRKPVSFSVRASSSPPISICPMIWRGARSVRRSCCAMAIPGCGTSILRNTLRAPSLPFATPQKCSTKGALFLLDYSPSYAIIRVPGMGQCIVPEERGEWPRSTN